MGLWNTIKLAQMLLRLVQEILDPIDVIFSICKRLGMIDPVMLEIADI